MDNIVDRLTRVLKLEAPVFNEIATDDAATGQALLVTALAGAIAAITGSGNFLGRIISGAIGLIIGLLIWTGLVLLVGKMFQGQAGYVPLLRVIGYASAPLALGIIPVIGSLAGIVYSILIQIKAVQEVNRVSQGSAVATVLIPFGVFFVIGLILAVLGALAGLAILGGLADMS